MTVGSFIKIASIMIKDFDIEKINSVVPANASRVMLTHDEPTHTQQTTLSYKGTADYQDGSTLSFSVPIAYKRLINLSYKQAKALAFLCLVRGYEQLTNNRCSYTVNSLHQLTGVHAKTIEERIVTLEKMGLIAMYDSFESRTCYIILTDKGEKVAELIQEMLDIIDTEDSFKPSIYSYWKEKNRDD